jgi:exonuclease SbcC
VRPIALRLKGFTAFRDEQEIVFDGLDLFAITGPTGSGKSSILDAMTYALFGTVERVGRQVGQLVSQGQPRMAVTFEFAVEGGRYRVTRSTPASRGQTRILLERLDDGEWVQAGEGADRVREADAIIREVIGLDYQAFTRSVLLPQGRFAEFLVGDPGQRRAILTELLGLELFERLARRAGERKREAEIQVAARERVLEEEYAGVTEEALAEAEEALARAEERERALAAAADRVRAVAARWEQAAREGEELVGLAEDLDRSAEAAGTAAGALEALAAAATEAEQVLRDRAKAVRAAQAALERAARARREAEVAWGGAVALAGLRATASRLVEARGRALDREAELAAARSHLQAAETALAEAEAAMGPAEAELAAARASLAEAEAELEAARHAHLVAEVRAGVRVGDPCPVCGARIERAPRATRPRALERAEAARERARTRLERAETARASAVRARDAAATALEAARRELERRERELAAAAEEIEALSAELAAALGGMPEDPLAVVDARLGELEGLAAEEERAREELEAAREAQRAAEQERDELARRVAEARGMLASLPVTPLLERARSRLRRVPAAPPALAGDETPARLAKAASRRAAALSRAARLAREAAAERAADEGAFVREAAAALAGLVEVDAEAHALAEVVELAETARTEAARRTAEARGEVERLRERLERLGQLMAEVEEHRARRARFDALAKELRADRIVAFLQQEALQVLATAGSARLAALSSGRYGLVYEDDEFSVVDTWNGEERRSARTLSGGETFLASLALALALSEQVASLSVTERARLDSLFLDEGFGTLDPESLEVVVEAVEQLGGDGRLVGVITHVPELAARMPVRLVVEKSPRGSRVRVEA